VQVFEYNRTNQPSSWTNPDTGNSYTVTPTQTYESQGTPCREFTMNSQIGGKTEQVYGTACRQADGSWKIVK
jgi:surface antigen